jgi:hypothetical protein
VTISDDPEEMPEVIEYVGRDRVLRVGSGQIYPVEQAIWDYKIGTTRVVKKWCETRKKEPSGKRTSPLDDINSKTWEPETTRELLDLLHVIGRCIELEPAQANLLERVVSGPCLGVEELSEAAVFPVQQSARKRPPRDDLPMLWQINP